MQSGTVVGWWLARHSCMEATNAKRPAGASSTIHEPMMLLLLGRHGGPEGSHCITRGFVTRSDLHRNRRRPAGEVHRSCHALARRRWLPACRCRRAAHGCLHGRARATSIVVTEGPDARNPSRTSHVAGTCSTCCIACQRTTDQRSPRCFASVVI